MSSSVGYTKFDSGLLAELEKMLNRAAKTDQPSASYDQLKASLGVQTDRSSVNEKPTDRPSGLLSKL